MMTVREQRAGRGPTTLASPLAAIAAVVALVATMLIAVAPGRAAAAGCAPFPDVDSSNVHCRNIAWLKDQNITIPADGKYHPAASVNRGAMAAFLFRLTHPGEASPTCTSKPFPDVSTSNVFCGYIKWAKDAHVAYGYGDKTYRPDNPVTRGAMAAYLHRIANPGHGAATCTSKPFDDVSTKDTFCGVIAWMAQTGITYGIAGTDNYGMTARVTRQAMASFLRRISDGPLALMGTYYVGADIYGLYDSRDGYYGVWFLDNQWAYWGMPKSGEPTCSKVTGSPNAKKMASTGWGCVRYQYNARTGALKVGPLSGSYDASKARPLTINGSDRYRLVQIPRPGTRFDASLQNAGWYGACPGIWGCSTWETYLALDKKGTFVLSTSTITSWGGGSGWATSYPPDERGTYQVLPGARIKLSFADGTSETKTIAVQLDDKGRPDPTGTSADQSGDGGLVIGTDWYWAAS